MLKVFNTKDEYQEWLNGTPLKSGVVAYIEEDNTAYFSTNNIDGNFETLECGGGASSGQNFKGLIDGSISGDIIIPDNVATIYANAFLGCRYINSVTFGSGVIEIGDLAFNQCLGLTSVIIPDNVATIGADAFANCSGLTSVTIGNGVSVINGGAFTNCYNLTTVTIGSGVTAIGDGKSIVFGNCRNLNTLYIYAVTPPTMDANEFPVSFYGEQQDIFVPADSVWAYKTAVGWSQFSDIIKPIPNK